jgi:hypothetical protein
VALLASTTRAAPRPQDLKTETAVAAPTAAPTATEVAAPTYTSINTAEPTSTSTPSYVGSPTWGVTLFDSLVSQYNVWSGAINYNSKAGKIFKDNGQHPDISTLVTFNIPSWAAGYMCAPRLRLDAKDSSKVSGSGLFDVFKSLAPATGSTTSWGPGNQRDQFIGRMKAVKPTTGTATSYFVDPTTNGGVFPCAPYAGKALGMEYVPVYDVDDIEWDDRYVTAGPEMVIY